MPTQEAKAHHVGEWASLRNTSPEIAVNRPGNPGD